MIDPLVYLCCYIIFRQDKYSTLTTCFDTCFKILVCCRDSFFLRATTSAFHLHDSVNYREDIIFLK